MKINNRDFESVQGDNYFNTGMSCSNECMDNTFDAGMNCCAPYQTEMMDARIPGVVCPPVYECPRETVCHRYICHEVPHIQPCNTRIINHHIYRHTYTPAYSCCEENEIQNVYERRCC